MTEAAKISPRVQRVAKALALADGITDPGCLAVPKMEPPRLGPKLYSAPRPEPLPAWIYYVYAAEMAIAAAEEAA